MANFFFNSRLTNAGGVELAPDLTFPSGGLSTKTISIDPSGGLTTALSLTGKYAITGLLFRSLADEEYTVKCTIDGVVVWNNTFNSGTDYIGLLGDNFIGGTVRSEFATIDSTIICNASFLLEIESATDTDVKLDYRARPIL